MKQFTFILDNHQQRPVIRLDNGLRALLDTGAYIPVWTDEENILKEKLGAQLFAQNVSFTGFGGKTTGNLYKVTLQIGQLVYPNMSIVANAELDTPFNLILSATMFQNLIYEVDDKNHKFNITIPDTESIVRNLRIKSINGRIIVLCNSGE